MESTRRKEEPRNRFAPRSEKFVRKAASANTDSMPISLWPTDFAYSQPSEDLKEQLFHTLSSDEITRCHRRNSDLEDVMEALERLDEQLSLQALQGLARPN
jgi:hypothetical protein